jgi:hypothetical protein
MGLWLLLVGAASAQVAITTDAGTVSFTGYVEAYGQVNPAAPHGGVTNLRGFDNRAGTFTLSNVALGASWDVQNVIGKVMLQFGPTADMDYAFEPRLVGGTAANASSADLWRYLQQAQVGYRISAAHDLTLDAGIFLSPIGVEGLAVRDNWNFSRSNLFFGLPFYHTGARATLPVGRWTMTLGVWNGWNSVVDGNAAKTVSFQGTYTSDRLTWSAIYMGGNERPRDAPEGHPWRHTLDTWVTWHPRPWLSLQAHVDGGFERNLLGTNAWAAGAAYARFRLHPMLHLTARGDVFREWPPEGTSSIFWPVPWVASATGTLDLHPVQPLSVRLEVRHDRAGGDAFYGPGAHAGDPPTPDAAEQTTLTLGVVAGF